MIARIKQKKTWGEIKCYCPFWYHSFNTSELSPHMNVCEHSLAPFYGVEGQSFISFLMSNTSLLMDWVGGTCPVDSYLEVLILFRLSKEIYNTEGVRIIRDQGLRCRLWKSRQLFLKLCCTKVAYSQIKQRPQSDSLWGKSSLEVCFEFVLNVPKVRNWEISYKFWTYDFS